MAPYKPRRLRRAAYLAYWYARWNSKQIVAFPKVAWRIVAYRARKLYFWLRLVYGENFMALGYWRHCRWTFDVLRDKEKADPEAGITQKDVDRRQEELCRLWLELTDPDYKRGGVNVVCTSPDYPDRQWAPHPHDY